LITSPQAALGSDILQACELSYPSLLTVHSSPHFSPFDIQEIVTPLWNYNDHYAQNAIICGPDSFNSMAVDALLDMGATTHELKILASKTWLENY
jgi:hypothetical protein